MKSSLGAILIALVVLATGGAAPARADDTGAALVGEALNDYDRGAELLATDAAGAREAFAESARKLQLVRDSGVFNGRLLYNLGNAYLQSGEIGRAIAAYRSAERLIPHDPRLQANLTYARSLRRDRLEATAGRAMVDRVLEARTVIPARLRWWLLGVAWIALWTLAGVRIVRRNLAPTPLLVSILAIAAILTLSIVGDAIVDQRRDGVLVADDVVVRKGNGDGFEPRFEQRLGEGMEVRILEVRPGWSRIELPDGREGWVKASDLQAIL